MRYHYQLRVKIRGDHLEYGYSMRCEEDHAEACMLKTASFIARKHNVPIGHITIRIESKFPRATKTFGGRAT